MTHQEVLKGHLQWQPLKMLTPSFELRSDDIAVGRISWMKEWGTLAEAQFGSVSYTFKRNGMWKPYLTVRAEGTPYDIARMELRWMTDSALKMQDGTIYAWSLASMWRQEWAFTGSNGSKPVVFKTKVTTKGVEAEVILEKDFQANSHAPLLVLLGWYLIASTYGSDGGETAAFLLTIA